MKSFTIVCCEISYTLLLCNLDYQSLHGIRAPGHTVAFFFLFYKSSVFFFLKMTNVDSQSSISTSIESSSPLYLHLSDGSNSITVEKLLVAANYRSWRRSFEIGLTSKRKLGFVTGTQKRDLNNLIKQEAWDTCNCIVISWIINNVSVLLKNLLCL